MFICDGHREQEHLPLNMMVAMTVMWQALMLMPMLGLCVECCANCSYGYGSMNELQM